jgi:hypothetical protein
MLFLGLMTHQHYLKCHPIFNIIDASSNRASSIKKQSKFLWVIINGDLEKVLTAEKTRTKDTMREDAVRLV